MMPSSILQKCPRLTGHDLGNPFRRWLGNIQLTATEHDVHIHVLHHLRNLCMTMARSAMSSMLAGTCRQEEVFGGL